MSATVHRQRSFAAARLPGDAVYSAEAVTAQPGWPVTAVAADGRGGIVNPPVPVVMNRCYVHFPGTVAAASDVQVLWRRPFRSEKRRVGKELRSRWSPYH